MFAGPNGSGKTELIHRLQYTHLRLGPVINSDSILQTLNKAGFLDLKEFGLSKITQGTWKSGFKNIGELLTRLEKTSMTPQVEIRENVLICKSNDLDAYSAALIADFLRYIMIEEQVSFSFETVMSHPGKIDFLKTAKERGYKTYLYFIATDDARINVSRVHNRVEKGGHPVPKQKIYERYERSLNLLFNALQIVDRAYILDNSKKRSSVLFEKKNDGKGYLQVENYPQWFDKSVIQKIRKGKDCQP
jgi:predicted ABC-type ATPase